jgi:long-chain acyl-CoA synthetase
MPNFAAMTERPDIDRETGLVRRTPPRRYPFGPSSVAAVFEAGVREYPDRLALVDGSRSWSYRELEQEVVAGATAIEAASSPGVVIAWALPNSAELVVGFLATLRSGRIWLGINPRLPAEARQILVRRSGAKRLIEIGSDWPAGAAGRTLRPAASIDPHAPAAMSPTSGTTGAPKLVVHSQHGLLWPGLASTETEPIEGDDRTLCALPLTTLTLMVLGPLTSLLRGGTAVVSSETAPAGLLGAIEEHEVTRLIAVPTLLHDLAEQLEPSGAGRPKTLRSVLVGGAGTTPELRDRFEKAIGIRPVLSYGLSETPTGVARTDAEHPHSASAMPPVRISVVGEDLVELPGDSIGRIRIGPVRDGRWAGTWQPMLGYWRQPDATAAALHGDGLLTEDLGRIDRTGRLRVVGRMSDVIVRGGTSVMPAEVESALLSHPAVREVSVVGVPDARLGERIAAAVVVDDHTLEPNSLRTHARSVLSGDRVPSEIKIVDELPCNALGKVIRPDVVGLFV